MKRKYIIAIIIILVIVSAFFLLGPYSPLNKGNIHSETFKIPNGYTITNQTNNAIKISNKTDSFIIHYHDEDTVKDAIKEYKKEHKKYFNITDEEAKIKDKKIVKTTATKINGTRVIHRDWFIKNGKVYDIQLNNTSPENDNTINEIISSL